LSAYFLSRSFVPAMCMLFLRSHGPLAEVHTGKDYEHRNPHEYGPPRNLLSRAFAHWEGMINTSIAGYLWLLRRVMRARAPVIGSAVAILVVVLLVFWPRLKREFFPEVDAGAFEIYVRGKTGTRIEETEERIKQVERFLKKKIGDDLEMQISELGLVPDWSAA